MSLKLIVGGIGAAIATAATGAVAYRVLTDMHTTISNPHIKVEFFTVEEEFGKDIVRAARQLMKGSDVGPIVLMPIAAANGAIHYARGSDSTMFFSNNPGNLDPDKFVPNVKVTDNKTNRVMYMQVSWSRFVILTKYFNSLHGILRTGPKTPTPPSQQKKGNRK